jgi:hypothetical protein
MVQKSREGLCVAVQVKWGTAGVWTKLRYLVLSQTLALHDFFDDGSKWMCKNPRVLTYDWIKTGGQFTGRSRGSPPYDG